MVFRGYMDESYDKERSVCTISCLIGNGAEWLRLVRDWRDWIDLTNRTLADRGLSPISRYHASDCNAKEGEFKEWPATLQIDFVCGLFDVLKKRHFHTVSISLDWDTFRQAFPRRKYSVRMEEKLAYCYLMIPFLNQIGKEVEKIDANKRVTLFHDHTDFNGAISDMFWAFKGEPSYKYGPTFVNIAPLEWRDCVALQPADMFAFEAMKEIKREEGSPRLSFQAMSLLGLPWKHVHAGKENISNSQAKVDAIVDRDA